MLQQMARTPQPRSLSLWVASFGSFDAAHGWAVNLFLVICLAALGVALLSGRPRLLRLAVPGAIVVCLADWVLVQDFGFLGGVGTDPNSMIPMALVFGAGYLAVARIAKVDVPAAEGAAVPARLSFKERLTARPAYTFRVLAALCAIGVTLVGAAPMAVASTNPNADPIVSQAIDGTPDTVNYPAPAFKLFNQRGQAVSLHSLRGKAVALTFLDPVCVSDCPIIAQELVETDQLLGPAARDVELVAVVINPVYRSAGYLVAFDRQEGLQHLSNWDYLTGSAAQLRSIWESFGILVQYSTGGAMIAHSDLAYVIDLKGRARYIIDTDPGPGTQVTKSSFSVVLTSAIDNVLRP
jgi:cytochrome oxidase Cu insertion factor (SCO1/SenC/PrrC family)